VRSDSNGVGCNNVRSSCLALAVCLASCTWGDDDVSAPDAVLDGGAESIADAMVGFDSSLDARAPNQDAQVEQPVCNGLTECGARYGEFITTATHISAATKAAAWSVTSQSLSVREQLASDALALTLEVFEEDGDWLVCHRTCTDGSVALLSVLEEVRSFLVANTAMVVTLLVEAHAPRERLIPVLRDADVSTFFYEHDGSKLWPELSELVETDRRVVVFASTEEPVDGTDAGGSALPSDDVMFVHSLDRWVARTREDITSLGTIDCRVASGESDAPFLLLHQHVGAPNSGAPSADLALLANDEDTVVSRLEACRTLHGRYPSFVALDFFETGAALRVIQRINRTR